MAPEMPNEYFDISTGKYLGKDKDPLNYNVYLTTETNWKAMKGEVWNSKVIGSVSPDGHKISSEVAAGIFNHYFNEAGLDINNFSDKTVIPQIEGNQESGWTDIGKTEYGSQYTGLNKGESRISAEKHSIGGTLKTKYDYINLFIHEGGSHIQDFKNNEKAGLNPLYIDARDETLFERNAIRMQVGHSSWAGTSQSFRSVIEKNAIYYKALTGSEINKYFKINYVTK